MTDINNIDVYPRRPDGSGPEVVITLSDGTMFIAWTVAGGDWFANDPAVQGAKKLRSSPIRFSLI